MAKNGWFGIYRSETAKNGQNWDLSWYISKWRDQVFMVFRIGYTNCFFKEFCDDLINHSWLYWTNSGCMAVCLSPNSILYDAESKIHWPWVIQTENERSILQNIWFLDDLAVSIDVGNNKASMAVSKLFLFKWNIEWSWAYLVKSSNIPTSSVSMFQFSIFMIRWVQFRFHLLFLIFFIIQSPLQVARPRAQNRIDLVFLNNFCNFQCFFMKSFLFRKREKLLGSELYFVFPNVNLFTV